MSEQRVSGNQPKPTSRLAVAAAILSLGSVMVLLAAPLGYRLGWWGYPFALLRLTPAAGVGAALGALVSLLALGFGWRSGAGRVLPAISVAVGGTAFGFLLTQVLAAKSLPEIHDISTDTYDPPAFVAMVALREAAGANPHVHGGPELVRMQVEAYPDLAPYESALDPAGAFDLALATARSLGWQIVDADDARRRIEASDTTLLYGFTDDVVIRVRPTSAGSRIDVRSLSRVGRSDVGKNAARIRAFMAALTP